MSRMYSRKKGKAGSTKPISKTLPIWVRHKTREVEMIIIKLAKEGMAPSQIGTHLRDVYGIPDVRLVCKKKISDILDKKNLLNEIPEDLMALIRKSVMLQKHLEENHHDMSAKRGLQLTRAKIKRLVDYYKKSKKLPIDFKYDSESIKLYVG